MFSPNDKRMATKPVNEEKKSIDALYNYNIWFSIYKKLAYVMAGLVILIAIIWTIIDLSVFTTTYNPHYWEMAYKYGVLKMDSWVVEILIWLGIGVAVAIPVWFVTQVIVSTKLVQMELIYKTAVKTVENEEKLNDCMTKIDEKILAPKAIEKVKKQ